MKNPWLKKNLGTLCGPCSVEDRIFEIKKFDKQKLKAVILWHGTQSSVKKAAERLLKKIIITGC